METTNVIIVTEATATGAATIEVLPMQTETSSNLVTEIIEAILDSTGDEVETDSIEVGDGTIASTTYTTTNIDAAIDAAALDTTAATSFETFAPTVEASTMNAALFTGTAPDAASVLSSPDTTTDVDAAAQAHTEVAAAAQTQADEAVARGDYEAAAAHREVAENEAYAAGDNSTLHGSDSTDLENADWQQDQANHYEQQQTQHAQAGAYEAAKEDAANAAYAHGNADWQAGGADHSGQAQLEEQQMDWAVYEEKNADYYANSADTYAAQGDYDSAATYAAEAVDHQAAADYHGDLGEHGGSTAVFDPASEVTVDTSYSTSTYDTSSVE